MRNTGREDYIRSGVTTKRERDAQKAAEQKDQAKIHDRIQAGRRI